MADVLKYNDVKDWDADTIASKVSELKKELFKMKAEASVSGLEKPHQLKVLKKNIAKLLTAKSAKK